MLSGLASDLFRHEIGVLMFAVLAIALSGVVVAVLAVLAVLVGVVRVIGSGK